MNDVNALLDTLRSAEVGIGTLIVILVVSLILLIVLCLPMVFVLRSKRISGSSKALWFILTALFSWLAYPGFLYASSKKDDQAAQARDASG